MASTHIYQQHEGLPSHINSTMADMHSKELLLEKLNSRMSKVGMSNAVEERTALVALDDPS
jgi:hypothetical protein